MTIARKAKPDNWMTLQAAADALGESRLAVLTRIVKGELVGKHIANRTVVRRNSVESVLASRESVAA